jgi:putative ABC transport system permease protein
VTLLDYLKVALAAIAANTLRSVLTTLGIIIGVASVIVMVAVGSGARSEVDKQINSLGTNLLVIWPGAAMSGGRSAGAGTSVPLSEGDMAAVRQKVQGVAAISGQLQGSAVVVRGNANTTTRVWGVHEQYFIARDWVIETGRELTAQDLRAGARVALVGQTVIRNLFGGEDPVGQEIRIKSVPFTVIGTLGVKGQTTWGQDQDDIVVLPMTAARGRIVGKSSVINDQVGSISVKLEDGIDLAEAQEQIEQVLRQSRRVQPGAEDNFSVRNLAEFMRARTAAQTTLGWLLGATSLISLIVGGIGIMNIMLVSVTERTREIGLRMAVGARRTDILLQFLIEAIALCVLGGLIGIVLGVGAAYATARLAEWPILISPEVVVLALAAAAATGIFFGFFPARRAAFLNPIEALRTE